MAANFVSAEALWIRRNHTCKGGGGCCWNLSSKPCGWASLLDWEFQWWPKANQVALLKGQHRISTLDMSSLKTYALPCFHCVSGWVHKVPLAGSPGGATSWGRPCGVVCCWVTGVQGRWTEHNLEQSAARCSAHGRWVGSLKSLPTHWEITQSIVWSMKLGLALIKLTGYESLQDAVCRHLVSDLGKHQGNICHLLAAKLP